jgi:cardiolipin synthase
MLLILAMGAFNLFKSLPNIISVARLLLVPVAVSLIASQSWGFAFVIFALAGVSDAVDGYLAKRFHLQSELGAYLDPLADKALLVSIYVTLAIIGILPRTLAILVVSRDLMIVGGVIVALVMSQPMTIRPLLISKINTAMQIVLAGAVLAAKAYGLTLDGWLDLMVAVVAALTVASTAAYLAQWLQHMSR